IRLGYYCQQTLGLGTVRDNLDAVQKVLADGGYTGKAFASSVQELMGAGRDCQTTNCTVLRYCQSDGRRAQFFMVGKEQAALEKLRA
ncbi:hypothetical protein HMPREF9080_01939, partial [Cardiobacterium valvarum F0432]